MIGFSAIQPDEQVSHFSIETFILICFSVCVRENLITLNILWYDYNINVEELGNYSRLPLLMNKDVQIHTTLHY